MNIEVQAKIKILTRIAKSYTEYADIITAEDYLLYSDSPKQNELEQRIDVYDSLFREYLFKLIYEYKKYKNCSLKQMRKFWLLKPHLKELKFNFLNINEEFYDFWRDFYDLLEEVQRLEGFADMYSDFMALDVAFLISLADKTKKTIKFNSEKNTTNNFDLDYQTKLEILKFVEKHYVTPIEGSTTDRTLPLVDVIQKIGEDIDLDECSIDEVIRSIEKRKDKNK